MRTHFSPWACLALCLPFPLSAQTGPGGIGSSTNNVLWLSADKGTTVSGGQVTNWTDRSGNSNTAAPSAASARPALVSGALNGQPVLRFDGSTDELRISDNSSIDLTAWHFFLVLRANLQKNYNAWLTKGDDSAENYEMLSYDDGNIHAPVLWTDNTRTSPSSPAGQVTTSGASIIEYSYKSSNGRSICTNGASVFTDTENRTPKVNARELYIGNERGTTGRFMDGDLAEVIAYKDRLNAAQRVIVNNYLAAKYGLALASDDLYTQDNPANGNFDFDVAGIGKVNSTNKQLDSKGSGQVRITSAEPAAFENNEYLLWGHNNGWFGTGSSSDYPSSIQGRWGRVWRVNEVTAAGVAADIGAVDITFDLSGMGSVTAGQLRLLVDTDNDGVFADETPINGATSVGGGSYRFANRTELTNGVRFTLGTTNVISTPLPIELLSFGVSPQGHEAMEVRWSTASEQDNALFTIERAADTATWEAIAQLPGAGNSNAVIAYAWTDGTPLDGTSYYRLKQTDTDGTSTWSDIVPVVRTAGDALRVFPNPAEDHASVRTSLPDGPLYLLDGLGRPVGPAIHLRSGAADLDLSALPPGMYFLRSSDPRSAPWPLMVH